LFVQQEQQFAEKAKSEKYFGTPLSRVEDQRFLTGKAQFISDIAPPGVLVAFFVRSPYAHARIRKIDSSEALELGGVFAVLTGRDFDGLGEVPCAVKLPFVKYPKHPPIAHDEVNYQGEIVAVILAESEYVAKDAEEQIKIEYEVLPAVLDPEKSISDPKFRVHEVLPDNVAFSIKQTFLPKEESSSNSGRDESKKPDEQFQKILSSSERVVSFRLHNQRIFSSAIETRSVIAEYNPSRGEITMWTATQYPHLIRTFVSSSLNFSEGKMRVIAPDLGGGFGGKSNVYAEEILVPYIAWKVLRGARPVKWLETRSEYMISTAHGRDHVQYVDVGVSNDGRIKALRVRIIADIGAYHHFLTPAFPIVAALDIPGSYKIPAYEMEVTSAFTNKKSTDAYRGVAASEACFCIEKTMDAIASELDLDPVDVRLRNYVRPEDYPYTNVMGEVTARGNLPLSLNLLLSALNYDEFRRKQRESRDQKRYLGVGFSTFWELGGFGPPYLTESLGIEHGAFESAAVRILPSGEVVVTTGSSSHGQGHETAFAQIAADALQVGLEDVTVQHGDTANAPYGIGTYASRSAAVGGTAVYLACDKILRKATAIAAHNFHADIGEITYERGTFFSLKDRAKQLSLKEVVREAYLARHLPPEMEPGMESAYYFNPQEPTFASGTHACIVEVDAETGKVSVLKYVAVNDFGAVINPLIVEGQVHGGVMQGLGQGLLEEIIYSNDGQLLGTNFLDYLIPTSTDPFSYSVSPIETRYYKTDTSANPLGVKGMGESGAIAAPAAVVNAVTDALRPFHSKLARMPLKPGFVWEKMHAR
jgi:aerobic carbon-monoxide dehydrogenase large subunit